MVYAPQRTAPGMIVRGLMPIYEVLSPDDMIGMSSASWRR